MSNTKLQISIRAARVNAGLTIPEAGKLLGLSNYKLSCIERGLPFPKGHDEEIKKRMCEIYHIDRENIFFA